MMQLSRRQFLKVSAGTVAVAAIADKALALTALQPVVEVDNPLGEYPDRSWERVYHDSIDMTHPLPGAVHRTIPMPAVSGLSFETAS